MTRFLSDVFIYYHLKKGKINRRLDLDWSIVTTKKMSSREKKWEEKNIEREKKRVHKVWKTTVKKSFSIEK